MIFEDTGVALLRRHSNVYSIHSIRPRQKGRPGIVDQYDIVERHGGELRVESTVGQGSVFTVSLLSLAGCEMMCRHGSTKGCPYVYPRENPDVDDDPSIRSTLKEVLSRESYQVVTAGSGEEALNVMRGTSFDLALLDLKMAGMDGLSLMKEIRRRSPFTGIIMLTGYATLESAIGALRQGAHDYLLKPCEPDLLKDSIREGLKKQCGHTA